MDINKEMLDRMYVMDKILNKGKPAHFKTSDDPINDLITVGIMSRKECLKYEKEFRDTFTLCDDVYKAYYKTLWVSIDTYQKICKKYKYTKREIKDMYLTTFVKKNHDYGDSFFESIHYFGVVASAFRIGDKIGRLRSLNDKKLQAVRDESILDTIMDVGVYSLMTLYHITWVANAWHILEKNKHIVKIPEVYSDIVEFMLKDKYKTHLLSGEWKEVAENFENVVNSIADQAKNE